jgi:serine/threonine protein phosphatase 1
MNTLVIGDIHGCYHELQALLDKAGLVSGDEIVAVGDIVDRGPETPEVLGFFQSTPGTQSIMGNHERKHIRGGRGEVKLSNSQSISKIQFGEAYPEALHWMSTLPLYLELPEAVIVHAYLEPGKVLPEQDPTILCGTMTGERRLRNNYDRPWYELYAGERPVIVGHKGYTSSNQPFIYRDMVFGLDTICVTGNSLSGILLPSFRILSVPSRGNLWRSVRQAYKVAKHPAAIRVVEPWPEQENAALVELIERATSASEVFLARLQSTPGYDELKPRQQAMLYAEIAGDGLAAVLLQMARVGKLNPDSARNVVRKAAFISDTVSQINQLVSGCRNGMI